MPNPSQPDADLLVENTDAIVEPDAADPADLAGSAALETADRQHDAVDEIAADADPEGPGHGASQEQASSR